MSFDHSKIVHTRANLPNFRPIAGGILSHPYDRFPRVFGYSFWRDYPYLLPCLFSASFAAFASLIALFFLEEARDHATSPFIALTLY